MSDEKNSVDETALDSAKEKLEHVETKTGSTTHATYKCEKCGHEEDIDSDTLAKMDSDEEINIPDHCGEKMKISVAG